jgi:hypothetical protein
MKNGNSDSFLREQIDALGDWFHNLDLAGIPTAPDHFLGNYPRFPIGLVRKRCFEAPDSKSSPIPKLKCMSAAGAMVLLLNYPRSILSDLCLSKP